ncbi:MAG: hypothetical protein FWD60_04400 [Candidatus Azobacteroides sp.]|nr:hypothetical protein [Candidatus Azobacteroides sp.]
MAQSIVTPQDLRSFAQILNENINQFNEIESSMNTRLNSYDWTDAVAVRFKSNFEATKEPINNLIQKMDVFIPYLNTKAEGLENEYLNI